MISEAAAFSKTYEGKWRPLKKLTDMFLLSFTRNQQVMSDKWAKRGIQGSEGATAAREQKESRTEGIVEVIAMQE